MWASFPIPSKNSPTRRQLLRRLGPRSLVRQQVQDGHLDLVQVMDSVPNSTSFADSQGFFPPYTSQLNGGSYSSSQLLSGFAKAATDSQIAPLNAKNWATAWDAPT